MVAPPCDDEGTTMGPQNGIEEAYTTVVLILYWTIVAGLLLVSKKIKAAK